MKKRNIIIISPQPWGDILLSKHHYALALAARGNKVYFLQLQKGSMSLKIFFEQCKDNPNITIVKYSHIVPYFLKFHARNVYHFFMRFQVKRMIKRINQSIDIVWDFDCNFSIGNLNDFKAAVKIFHPVDKGTTIPRYKKPDIIFSISPSILKYYQNAKVPGYFINHGLGECFRNQASNELKKLSNGSLTIMPDPKNVGYIGNLKHSAIDRKVLIRIIKENTPLNFHLFGPYSLTKKERDKEDLREFISFLKNAGNVILHGPKPKKEIIRFNEEIDLYLTVYKKSNSYFADNSHKIIEYLSTGKLVVSSFLSVYQDLDLLLMPNGYSNEELPLMFKNALNEWEEHNTLAKKKDRIKFAIEHSYDNQLDKVIAILAENKLI